MRDNGTPTNVKLDSGTLVWAGRCTEGFKEHVHTWPFREGSDRSVG